MRLLLTVSALVASRALAAETDLCTSSEMNTFTAILSAVSSCAASVPYNWGGSANPTASQQSAICQCSTDSLPTSPACSLMKGPDKVTLSAHFTWVTKDKCANSAPAPSANVTAAPTTAAPVATPTTKAPTSASPVSTPTSAPAAASDLCTVVQISAFSTALNTASSCLGSTSYNWGGHTNPTNSDCAGINKCPSASAFSIPSCSVMKGSDKVTLSDHYTWVLTKWCPSNGTSQTSETKKSSSNIGMIAGIAGGGVVVVLIIAIVLCKRKSSATKEESSSHNVNVAPSPATYQPMQSTPEYTNKSLDVRPSGVSTVGTASTFTATFRPSGTGSHGSTRLTETGKWDDPAIVAVRIPFDAIFVGALLSKGGFGEVHRGTYRGETVAIKRLLPERRKDLAQIDGFLSEVKLMSALEHERIVKFIGVAWNSLSDACMVVEYMENGDLRSLLGRWDAGPEQRPNGFDADKVKIAMHVAHALVYLHSLSPVVVHRDLKSKNVLLDANLDAKLTDFGISRERADETMTAGVGSSLWMAPEIMMGNRYDEKADIFSFGVMLSELDTHQLPYSQAKVTESGQKLPETAVLQQVMLGRLQVVFTNGAHPDLVQLGRECISLDPKKRPTTAQLLHRVHLVMREFQ